MDIPETGSVVSGVGNEVIILLLCVVAGTTMVLGLKLMWSIRSQQNLHPAQVSTVQNTRADMGITAEELDVPAENCPVCLGSIDCAVQTNCGHKFCAQCILEYWRHDQWPRAARCPVCRRQVTLLLGRVTGAFGERITDYNQRMSGEWRSPLSYVYDVPTILTHLWQELFSERGPFLIRRLYLGYIVILLALYLLSPFDILPESVFGLFGYLDDLMLCLIAIVYISFVYRTYLAQRA